MGSLLAHLTRRTVARSFLHRQGGEAPGHAHIYVPPGGADSTRMFVYARAAAKMFLTLGLEGTFVAVIGLYGVRSYLVSCRIRELGERDAELRRCDVGIKVSNHRLRSDCSGTPFINQLRET